MRGVRKTVLTDLLDARAETNLPSVKSAGSGKESWFFSELILVPRGLCCCVQAAVELWPRASHSGGLSRVGAQPLRTWALIIVAHGPRWSEVGGIFLDQGWELSAFIGRWTLNHWASREVCGLVFKLCFQGGQKVQI